MFTNRIQVVKVNLNKIKFSTNIYQNEKSGICEIVNEKRNTQVKSYDSIPGPKPVPILGNIWHFLPKIGRYSNMHLHDLLSRFHEEYGNILKLSDLKFYHDTIIIFDPQDIETVYRNDGPYPKRGVLSILNHYRDIRPEIFKTCRGVFCHEGEEWLKLRSKINPILLQPRTVKQYALPIFEITNELIKKWKLNINESSGEVDDIENDIRRWTLESVTYVTLNLRLDLFGVKPNLEAEKFVADTLNFFDFIFHLEFDPLWKYIPTSNYRKFIKLMDFMIDFIQASIKKSLQNSNANQIPTIFSSLSKHGNDVTVSTVIDVLFGGVDTTSKAAIGLLYYLSINPQVQHQLRREITKVLPNSDSPITPEILEKIPYLRSTLKELFRVFPVGFANSRLCNKDIILSGYHIPKNTVIWIGNSLGLSKQQYFSEPKIFMPERWLRTNNEKNEGNPWIFQPFGYGPRSCIGQRLSYLELEIFLLQIIRNFKLEWHHEEMTFKSRVLYEVADPLKVKFIPI